MAQSKWKRVLVTLPSGEKAYRYTDGNSYRILPPAKDATKDRNERRGLSGGSSGPSLSEQARQLAGPAGGETRTARAQGRDTKQNKPAAKPTNTGPKPGNYKSRFAGYRDKAHKQAKEITGQTPAKPSETTPAKQARTGGSNNTVSRAVTGKPAPKPAGKVPASNAGMKNQDKNFRGNPERKDSIASTLRELRGMGSGRKAAESKMSKPEDKSRYVASNGKPYKGPAFGNSKPSTPKKEDKKMSLAEEIRRRRMGQ